MRRFVLVRDVDVSGVSGEGPVVWGILFPDGYVAYRWNTSTATTCLAASIEDVEKIHGHGGATRLVWLDTAVGAMVWQFTELGEAAEPLVIPAPSRAAGRTLASPERGRL